MTHACSGPGMRRDVPVCRLGGWMYPFARVVYKPGPGPFVPRDEGATD